MISYTYSMLINYKQYTCTFRINIMWVSFMCSMNVGDITYKLYINCKSININAMDMSIIDNMYNMYNIEQSCSIILIYS